MFFNKKLSPDLNTDPNNIQINQRKENLIIFNPIDKRSMFTKGGSNISNLKKSGDLIISTTKDSIIRIGGNTTAASTIKGLDLAKNINREQNIAQLKSATTIAIKNISSGKVYPMQVDRTLATYGKINKNYIIEWKHSNELLKVPFSKFKKIRLAEAEEDLYNKKISAEQYVNFLKRMNAIDLSYVHATIGDIIEEDEEYVTVIYHIITTTSRSVDYGGLKIFTPIFLWNDKIQEKDFFTIPVTFLHKMKKTDYEAFFLSKNSEAFKNNEVTLKDSLCHSLNKLNEFNVLKLLNVNKYCLEVLPSEIDPKEVLPDSTYGKDVTGYIITGESL